jgi:hypothetical protein
MTEDHVDEREVVQINYWKEVHKEINQTIRELSGLVLLIHNSLEFTDIVDFLNTIRKDEKLTVLYISLINSYKKIKNVLENKPLLNKRLNVVDCVSGFLIELQDDVACVYRKPPHNLEEMKELVSKNVSLTNPNMVIVDSLTQFINFSMPDDNDLHHFYRFLQSLKDEIMRVIIDTVILLYDDKMGSLRRLPTMFTNHILRIEVIKEKPEWHD